MQYEARSAGPGTLPRSSRGPSQKQSLLVTTSRWLLQEGPICYQISQGCGQWAAAGWTQWPRSRDDEDIRAVSEPPNWDPPLVGSDGWPHPSMAFSFFICRTNELAQWASKRLHSTVYGMRNCFHCGLPQNDAKFQTGFLMAGSYAQSHDAKVFTPFPSPGSFLWDTIIFTFRISEVKDRMLPGSSGQVLQPRLYGKMDNSSMPRIPLEHTLKPNLYDPQVIFRTFVKYRHLDLLLETLIQSAWWEGKVWKNLLQGKFPVILTSPFIT